MSIEHTVAEAVRADMYGRMHLQTGTLDTTGYGESTLDQVAVVYRHPEAVAPQVGQRFLDTQTGIVCEYDGRSWVQLSDPDSGAGDGGEQQVDDDPSRDLDPTGTGQDDKDDGEQDPDPLDPVPPVEQEPNAAKERPPVSGRSKRRAADPAAG